MLNDLQMPTAFKALHRKQMRTNPQTAEPGPPRPSESTEPVHIGAGSSNPSEQTVYTKIPPSSRSKNALNTATDANAPVSPTEIDASSATHHLTASKQNEPFTLISAAKTGSESVTSLAASESSLINQTTARLDDVNLDNSLNGSYTISQQFLATSDAQTSVYEESSSSTPSSPRNACVSPPQTPSSMLETPITTSSTQPLNVTWKPDLPPKQHATAQLPLSTPPLPSNARSIYSTQAERESSASAGTTNSPSLSTRSCPAHSALLNRDSSLVRLKISSVASFSSGVDIYGFKKPVTDMSVEDFDTWSLQYAKYMDSRLEKWENLLKSYGLTGFSKQHPPERFPPDSHRIRKYVRKGIPPSWRGAAWFYYAKGPEKLNAHPGLYTKLVQESANLVNNDTEHIERDLHRTFPDNVHFRNNPHTGEESPLLKSLRRVLTAFSVYCPRVGYCQSLNFVAGNLLLFMAEEKAFWMLVIITQQHLPGLHDVNLEQVNIAQGVLMLSVRDRMPKVWQTLNRDNQLEENFISSLPPISLCTAPWFMSLMVNVLPTETLLRVWDCFFLEGAKTLYRISLAVFKLMEPQLIKATDELEVFQIIQSFPNRLYDPELLLKTCYKRQNGFGHLSNEDIALLRAFVVERRRQSNANAKSRDETSDRREYARLHRGRRIRARLKLYR